jgi:hypothetical protein
MLMFKINKKNVVALIVALGLTTGFLWAVLTPPSIFNFLPYEIHESIRSTNMSEIDFIKIFDIGSAMVLFIKIFDIGSAMVLLILSYFLARNCFTAYGIFSNKK